MPETTALATLIRHPGILRPYDHILLLSHMRANTSLLGHIFGSNPEVEGYYELHIGYYSWKSLVRQKLQYFAKHRPKKGARFMFDKVLHDDHAVNLQLFRRAKVIFSLRAPERTIPSIVSLYKRVEPDHAFSRVEGATEYYMKRLSSLKSMAEQSPVDFLYLDADALRSTTDRTLASLSAFIGLQQPLKEHYDVQPLTGTEKVGDSSESIISGKVRKTQQDYGEILVPLAMLESASKLYNVTRANLLALPQCKSRILLGAGGMGTDGY